MSGCMSDDVVDDVIVRRPRQGDRKPQAKRIEVAPKEAQDVRTSKKRKSKKKDASTADDTQENTGCWGWMRRVFRKKKSKNAATTETTETTIADTPVSVKPTLVSVKSPTASDKGDTLSTTSVHTESGDTEEATGGDADDNGDGDEDGDDDDDDDEDEEKDDDNNDDDKDGDVDEEKDGDGDGDNDVDGDVHDVAGDKDDTDDDVDGDDDGDADVHDDGVVDGDCDHVADSTAPASHQIKPSTSSEQTSSQPDVQRCNAFINPKPAFITVPYRRIHRMPSNIGHMPATSGLTTSPFYNVPQSAYSMDNDPWRDKMLSPIPKLAHKPNKPVTVWSRYLTEAQEVHLGFGAALTDEMLAENEADRETPDLPSRYTAYEQIDAARSTPTETFGGWQTCRGEGRTGRDTPREWLHCRDEARPGRDTPREWLHCRNEARPGRDTPREWLHCRNEARPGRDTPRGWQTCRDAESPAGLSTTRAWDDVTVGRNRHRWRHATSTEPGRAPGSDSPTSSKQGDIHEF